MRKPLRWILIILGSLLVIILVCWALGAFGKGEAVSIAVERATKRDITEVVSASGKIYPEVEVKVASDVSGEITDLYVKEGDSVKRGQILARIYADIYNSDRLKAAAIVNQQEASVENSRASIASYKAQLDQTQAAYKREKTLLDEKVVSESEYETAQSQYLSALANYNAALQSVKSGQAGVISAQASLTEADKDLSRTIIRAPMDGIVSLLDVKKGERVVGFAQMAGTEILRVADMSAIEVQVNVGENDIPKVNLGDTANVEVDAYGERKFLGIVTQIANANSSGSSSSSNGNSGSGVSSTDVTNYTVHVRLIPDSYRDLIAPGKPFPFRPGMSANADIQTQHRFQVLSIPILSVTTDTATSDSARALEAEQNSVAAAKGEEVDAASVPGEDREVVYLLRPDNTVKKVEVQTGIEDNSYIEVLSGLRPGDTVVSAPYDAITKVLKTGTKVKVVPKEKLFETK